MARDKWLAPRQTASLASRRDQCESRFMMCFLLVMLPRYLVSSFFEDPHDNGQCMSIIEFLECNK